MNLRKLALFGALAIAMLALSGVTALAVSRSVGSDQTKAVLSLAPPTGDQTAPSASSFIAEPALPPGSTTADFSPGYPGFGNQGVNADGVSAWGVAFKEVSDASTQPDAALIKSAVEDARSRAATLASAAGVSMGKLLAISDFGQNQAFYNKPCSPVPLPGSSGAAKPPVPIPAPQIQPLCQPKHYVVAWVLVRYQIS